MAEAKKTTKKKPAPIVAEVEIPLHELNEMAKKGAVKRKEAEEKLANKR